MALSQRPSPVAGGISFHQLPERLDVSNTRQAVLPIRDAVERGEMRILLDFSATHAVDSTALGAVVQVYKAVRAQGGELVLCGVGDAVRRVLSITRLDQVFSICTTRQDAEKLLASR